MSKINTKKILVLSSDSSDAKNVTLWCLRESGYPNPILLGNRSKNKEVVFFPLCKKFYFIPENYSYEERSPEIVEIIRSLVVGQGIDIVLPSGFSTIKFLSQYKDQISKFVDIIPVPPLETINMLGNKMEFSKFCENNGIPHPKTYLLEDIEKVRSGQIPVKYPLMTKPLFMSSSKGIIKFEDPGSLLRHLTDPDENKFNGLPLLLQEYVPGPVVGFNGFATNGNLRAWTIQEFISIPRKNKPPFLWIQYVQNDKIFNIGKSIIGKSRYSGPMNIDLIIDERDGKAFALEVNPRFWATTFVSNCDGVNFVDVAIKSSFDQDYIKKPKYSKRVWGSPHRIIELLLSGNKKNASKLIFLLTWLQIKYMVLNTIFSFIASMKMNKTSYQAGG